MEPEAFRQIVADSLAEGLPPALTPREGRMPSLSPGGRVLAVVGPRRAGKTFFLYQMMGEILRAGRAARDEILFVDFEDYRLRDARPEDAETLLEAFAQATGKPPRFLLFDEIHRLPHWSRVLRTLHNRRRYAIAVTGSNAALLASDVATELRGRYEDRLVLPFSFREFLRHRGLSPDVRRLDAPGRGLVARAFDDYLRRGGFPEAATLEPESARRRLLQSYFDTIFFNDLVERHGIRARHLLDLLMRNALEGAASVFSISAFEKQLKARGLPGSKRSIAEYLRRLEEAFFLATSEKFDFSPRRRTMNPKKTYLMDTGFALLGGAFSENRGRLLENAVALEFFRRRRRFFYAKGEGECDFVVQSGTRPAEAWQVCWEVNTGTEAREVRGLLGAMREFKIPRGGILTSAQEGTRRADGREILLTPVWKWLLSAPIED